MKKLKNKFYETFPRIFPIVFLQETWLYRYQTNIITEICNNTEFVCGCVDDNEPVPPSLHMREYGGTCILWHSPLDSVMRKLPEMSARINVVELKWSGTPFCLVYVYFPGVAENEIRFEEIIFTKYSPTHTIICGGDFKLSLHRVDYLRRDELFQNFLTEHGVMPGSSYPVKDPSSTPRMTVPHRLIAFLWTRPSKAVLSYSVLIPEVHYLNL